MSAGFLRFPTTNTHTLRRSADNRNLALQINWQLMAVTSPLLQISPPMGWRSLRNVHYAEIFNAQFMLIFLYFSRCYVVIKRTEKIKNTTTSANAVSQSASHRAYFYGSALVHIDSYVVPDFSTLTRNRLAICRQCLCWCCCWCSYVMWCEFLGSQGKP